MTRLVWCCVVGVLDTACCALQAVERLVAEVAGLAVDDAVDDAGRDAGHAVADAVDVATPAAEDKLGAPAVKQGASGTKKPSVSRNKACPCGSGRKYKNCCLPAKQAAARREQTGETMQVQTLAI